MEGKRKIGLVINIILTCIGLAGACGAFGDSGNAIVNCIAIAMYLMIFYYIFFGYNIPHGNLFRWLVLIYSFTLAFSLVFATMASNQTFPNVNVCLLILSIVLVAFISGRLHKFKQNIVYMSIITAILIYACLAAVITGGITFWASILLMFAPLIMWIDIVIAYVTRFAEHKEAGLEEK